MLGGGEEGGVAHVERVEGALGEERGVLLVRGGLEGVAEEIEGDVGVERGGAGSGAEALVGQPVPAGAVVGEGEVRRCRAERCRVRAGGRRCGLRDRGG